MGVRSKMEVSDYWYWHSMQLCISASTVFVFVLLLYLSFYCICICTAESLVSPSSSRMEVSIVMRQQSASVRADSETFTPHFGLASIPLRTRFITIWKHFKTSLNHHFETVFTHFLWNDLNTI